MFQLSKTGPFNRTFMTGLETPHFRTNVGEVKNTIFLLFFLMFDDFGKKIKKVKKLVDFIVGLCNTPIRKGEAYA